MLDHWVIVLREGNVFVLLDYFQVCAVVVMGFTKFLGAKVSSRDTTCRCTEVFLWDS